MKNCKEMTVEELMKPRIKLIAPIPKIFSCGIEVGEVWQGKEVDGVIMFNLTGAHCIDLDAVKKYPHLFKILGWWEDRDTQDMPQYVKIVSPNSIWDGVEKGEVRKVRYFNNQYGALFINAKGLIVNSLQFYRLLPATEQEFLNQTA